MVPGSSAPVSPTLDDDVRPPARRRTGLWLLAALVVVVALFITSVTYHLPYYLESPGSAQSVTPLITVDPAHRHPVAGDVLLSTVALTSNVVPLQMVFAWLDPNVNVVGRATVTGGVTPQQFNLENADAMVQSKQVAEVVALRRLGYPVPEHGDGAFVDGVDPRSGSQGRLQAGDLIVAADGKPVALAQDLEATIRAHQPGQPLSLTVDRPVPAAPRQPPTASPSALRPASPSTTAPPSALRSASPSTTAPPRFTKVTVVVPLSGCPEVVPGCAGTLGRKPYLGISLQTHNDHFDFPFKIDISLNNVGGPSAGLAFVLGVLDMLGSGRLTAGHRVAVTGTIDLGGVVGPIGGIALKTVAVERAGADVFLVPKDTGIPGDEPQYSAAVAKAKGHHLKVYAVGTLDDALNVLHSLGGDLTGITPAPRAVPG
jgi:PDZ domain-containing protein